MKTLISGQKVLLAVLLSVTACTKVPLDNKDATPPTVELKMLGASGVYAPVSTTTLSRSGAPLTFVCVVSDPQGVHEAALSFIGGSDTCTTGSGAVWSGSFPVEGLPKPQSTSASADASGKVPTSLPVIAKLKQPLSCAVPGSPVTTGYPIGAKVQVQCSGLNWSASNTTVSAAKTATIELTW